MSDQDQHVLRSWEVNAAPWTAAIADGVVKSRILVTNAAIVDAVMAHAPSRVIDVGCGEGWLCRALGARGVTTLGVDAIPALVADAQRLDPAGAYRVLTYEAIGDGALAEAAGTVDLAVCNFSLIGEQAVERLCHALRAVLAPTHGRLVIQTLHPLALLDGPHPYADGWRPGSWTGFPDTFSDPAPWFARTFAGWIGLLTHAGFRIDRVQEPLHPETGRPASLILSASATA